MLLKQLISEQCDHCSLCTSPIMELQHFSRGDYVVKGARYLLIIHEVLVAMDFFPAGVQDETLEEVSQSCHNNDFNLTHV